MQRYITRISLNAANVQQNHAQILKRQSTLTVHKPDPTKMSHEECQKNVIIGSNRRILWILAHLMF